MSDELPEGWAKAPLQDVAQFNPRHPKGLDDAMPVSFAPMAAVSESGPDFKFLEDRPLGKVRQGFTHFAEGDVLFAKITPCMENGKGAVATGLRNGLGCGTTELIVLRPFGGIDAKYIYRFLAQPSVREEAKERFTSTAGQARVPTVFVEELEIPLAPLAEQRRIVEKLQQLLAKVDACQQRLAKVPVLLKRFRQSVLAAACSGRLTADWRHSAGHRISENPLTRIAEARRNASIADGLNRHKPYRNPVVPGGGLPFDIPRSWGVASIDQVTTRVTKGTSPNWQGFDYAQTGIPFIRSQNVRWGALDLNDLAHLPPSFNKTHEYSIIQQGDVLLNLVGASIGRAAVATHEIQGANCNQAVAVLRPLQDGIRREYLLFCLLSPHIQSHIHSTKVDVARANFNLDDVRPTAIPIPPLNEQDEIVRCVTALFALVERVEARVDMGQQQVDGLAASLLAKAFRGELVPTEAELARQEGRAYEPASVLLERVQQQRIRNEGGAARPIRSRASTAARKIKRTARSPRRAVMSR